MMDKYCKEFSLFLMHNNNIKNDDAEMYEYATKVLFQSVINIGTTILIGVSFRMIKECLSFISIFILLRKFTGGLHAKKYSYCFISSTILIIISMLIIRAFERNNLQCLFIGLITIAVLIICVLAPIVNENKLLSNVE